MRQFAMSISIAAALVGGCGEGYHTVGFLDIQNTALGNNRNIVGMGLGDLDGDGRADVVVVNSQNEVNVLISKGDGLFATGVAYPTEQLGNAQRSMAVSDLTGDGRADVVVGNVQNSNISIYYNQGSGLLSAATGNPMGVNCQPVAMATADMNHDDQPDIVIACTNPNEIHVLKNRGGTSGFDPPYTLTYDQTVGMGNPPPARNIAVGKLNGDDDLDIAVGTDNDLRILNNPNEGPRNYVVSIPVTTRVGALAMGDVNGDGTNDVSVLLSSQEVRVYEYATGGTYSLAVGYQNLGQTGRGTTQTLGLGDFVKDGKSDLLVTLPNPAEVKLVVSRGEVNNNPNPVTASYRFQTGLTVQDNSFAVADVTGDGLPDVVFRNGNNVSVLVNASSY